MQESGVLALPQVGLAWRRRSVHVDGTPIVVMAHGLTDSAACWGQVASRLPASYDVVCFDARGHGRSGRAADYSAEAHTADLVGLVRALDLVRPVLVGHSMGGVHSALAAARLDVAGVVAVDPHWPEQPEDGTKDVAASRRRVVEVARLTPSERMTWARSVHPEWGEPDLEAFVQARGQVDPDVVDWFGSWRTTNRWREHVAALTCPGLLVTGDRRPTATPAAASEARRCWPQLRTVVVPGAGHDVYRDRFEAFCAALLRFLDSLRLPR